MAIAGCSAEAEQPGGKGNVAMCDVLLREKKKRGRNAAVVIYREIILLMRG